MSNEVSKTRPDALLGRRQRKALAVRQALFDAGLAAFERQPIGLVSVLDITETADVAKGVFYLQFRSKDDYLLALWEHVQACFLERAKATIVGCRSKKARVAAVVTALLDFAHAESAAARFWLRMSGYFPDEIGEPGHLFRIHEDYLSKLAAILSLNKPSPEQVNADKGGENGGADFQLARLVDAMVWAGINSELQQGEPLLESSRLIKAILAGASAPQLLR